LFGLAGPESACEAAAEEAKKLGYAPYILSSCMAGEAKDVGIVLAGITNEIMKNGRPFPAPCALISGGETTVTIHGPCGEGGPNQETALGFAFKLHSKKGVVFASIDTDGTDGPCDIAGGLVDGSTMKRLKNMNIDLSRIFQRHSSSEVLRALGDEILTGHTGTNVMNLRVVLISAKEKS
jgi:glycerate-2-kinase